MAFDYDHLLQLRKTHPAWRLLHADHGPFIVTFLDQVFREENNRTLSESQLIQYLEDFLYAHQQEFNLQEVNQNAKTKIEEPSSFANQESLFSTTEPRLSREPKYYLDEWASDQRGWLRKFYPPGSDEPHYDLTPATEKAFQWIEILGEQSFVGTESRLYSAVQLLREIVHGSEEDTEARIHRLEEEKTQLEAKIKAIRQGQVQTLDDREVRERFLQFTRIARELLGDFRMVEQNFRLLDQQVREEIAGWSGEKGEFLSHFFFHHDAIRDSDQGQSFQAFWNFLMSPAGQEELTELLDRVYTMDQLPETKKDQRLRRIHYDWMSAGEQTQRTAARLSQQLRRFLDDKTYLENKRIINLLDSIEKHGLSLRTNQPSGSFMELDSWQIGINLPLDRPLYSPTQPIEITSIPEDDETDIDMSRLYEQLHLDSQVLKDRILVELAKQDQISLEEIIDRHPLDQGLAELLLYLTIATKDFSQDLLHDSAGLGHSTHPYGTMDEHQHDLISWTNQQGIIRQAKIPRIIFHRSGANL